MPTGKLLLTLRSGRAALPAENCFIRVKDGDGNTVFEETVKATDSGISKEIETETPPMSYSLDEENTKQSYALLYVSVTPEHSYRMQINGIQVFENRKASLPVNLIPLPENTKDPQDAEKITYEIPKHHLCQNLKKPLKKEYIRGVKNVFSDPEAVKEEQKILQNENSETSPKTVKNVYIPETITVHLGRPDSIAENVTVTFPDYIKNVACSEIYPTWPEEALKANILAQISIALNRVYTEWYRSKGYDFEITNSTAFDQAFVYGRNIFANVSEIVDGIFNNYIKRPLNVEPLFAQYCDGSTTTCPGLSQWGTVSLAKSGLDFEDILSFYYGDIEIAETDDIRKIEESYRGVPLTLGSIGEEVLILQEQLNRIAINYPEIPLTPTDSIFGRKTERSVMMFQKLFILPETGVADKATWYRISYIYTAVKRLSEITSEGQRASYREQKYPGNPIKTGSKGSEVQEIQFYLSRISFFNPSVQSPKLDGIFGRESQNAVKSFQNYYSLPETGFVNEITWNRIVEVYNGTSDNTDEPGYIQEFMKYPGTVIKKGVSGGSVLYMQRLLNVINDIFIPINTLDEDGKFGSATEKAVNKFCTLFGYPADGQINEETWNKIYEIYVSVASKCIFRSSDGDGTRKYCGNELSYGSRGENVLYVQSKINYIYKALPVIGELDEDSVYGRKTERSVKEIQRVFGMTDSGNINESSWMLLNYLYTSIQNGCLKRSVYIKSFSENAENAFAENKETEQADDLSVSKEEVCRMLNDCGIFASPKRIFSRRLRLTLLRWQKEKGLPLTGKADAQMVMTLKRESEKARKN